MTEIHKVFEREGIQAKIFTIRGKQVMMDRDLAELYGVETKVLNQAVKRNIERFPDRYCFRLSNPEKTELVTNCDRFASWKHSSSLPYAFCEPGVAMLSGVLKSETAVKVSIRIIDAFIEMRKFLKENGEVFMRLEALERKQVKTEENVEKIFAVLYGPETKPKQGIFYDGQVFDAYTFVADLIRRAEISIMLIDNYVDDTVLRMFAKRRKGVSLCIYTKRDSVLALDIAKYRSQYGAIDVKEFKNSHDRFLLIDGKEVYHIGASLKDLGNKWFAFSKMEMSALDILKRL